MQPIPADSPNTGKLRCKVGDRNTDFEVLCIPVKFDARLLNLKHNHVHNHEQPGSTQQKEHILIRFRQER